MQTVITGQTTLENGLMVFSVCHINGTEETREEFVYKTPSDVLRRLRRDRQQREKVSCIAGDQCAEQFLPENWR